MKSLGSRFPTCCFYFCAACAAEPNSVAPPAPSVDPQTTPVTGSTMTSTAEDSSVVEASTPTTSAPPDSTEAGPDNSASTPVDSTATVPAPSGSHASVPSEPHEGSSDIDVVTPIGGDPSAELYEATALPRFDIELPVASIDALNLVLNDTDPKQDVYVSANFTYAGETVTNVGIRIKGEGSFQRLDRKPAWKIKFDEFVEGQSFRGLKRLALNNAFEDPSFIAERLAYDLYRAAEVPAPRCNNALVYVNGTFYGVYVNVEAEDKAFLRRWFRDAGGNLYEEGQMDFVPGAEDAFDLETNEMVNDRSDMISLIEAVQGATDPATFLDDLGRYVDVNQFLRFTALEAATNQWDMYAYTVFWVNNMRLYNDPLSGRFHFIPWGHDLSMKPYRDSGKPFIRLFELARQYDRANGPVTSGLLFQRCLQSGPCIEAYRAAVQDVIAVYESADLEERAKSYYDQIKSAVYEDARKNVCCDSPPALTNPAFEAGYQSVLDTVRGRVAALREDLSTGP